MKTWLFLSLSSVLLASAASAQIDTYRPGQPYSAVSAKSPDQCVSACGGDAACQGWNFVRLRDTAAICEFNAVDAAPVPSPGAISGGSTQTRPASARLVRMNAAPTVRIGEPAQFSPPRKIVRQPVPAQISPHAATHRKPVQKPLQQAALPQRPQPRFRHALDARSLSAPQPAVAPVIRPPAPRQLRPQLDTHSVQNPRPPIGQPISAPAAPPLAKPVAAAPRSPFAKPPSAPPAPVQPAPQPAPLHIRPLTQDSLFGYLHDDVAAPAAADPATLDNPEAPIATSRAVPVAPVSAEKLKGLAGG